MKKSEKNRFKNQVFVCSVENNKGETISFYQTAKNRFEAYEEICKLYPIKAGYCRRLVNEQI